MKSRLGVPCSEPDVLTDEVLEGEAEVLSQLRRGGISADNSVLDSGHERSERARHYHRRLDAMVADRDQCVQFNAKDYEAED